MSDGNILSQEEVDALMNTNDEDELLTEEEIDVLGEVGNIAMGSAATALYTLLDQQVEITAPEVEIINFEELTEEYKRPCVLVKVDYISGLEGMNLLIIEEKDAAVISDLMMGGDGHTVDDFELDEIHLSAVGEAMNQMMGSASTAMSSIIDEIVNISPPIPEYIDLNTAIEAGDEYFGKDEEIVSISFQLKVGDLIDSSFKQLSRLDFTKQLVKSLTEDDSGGLTAKDGNSRQDEVAAVREEKIKDKERSQKEVSASETNVSTAEAAPSSKKVTKDEVGVKTAQFPDFDNGDIKPLPQNMELIKDVPLEVAVRLGETRMTIEEILELGEGSIIELDKLAGEPVDLYVNGKLVAKGEVVVIDENFGFRVKDIISPVDRINKI